MRSRKARRPVQERTKAAGARLASAGGSAGPSLLRLQRTHGNQHVQRLLRSVEPAQGRGGLISTGQLATNLRRDREARHPFAASEVRFRLPTAAEVQSILAAGNVPEDKLKDSIALALTRMAKEGKLTTKDTVPDIIKKLFPAPGKFDEKELEKIVDVKDRNLIYQTVNDAETKVSSTDKPKLLGVIDDAMATIDTVRKDDTGLKEVFGSKATLAKDVYLYAKRALEKVKGNLDKAVDTDYNRDDEQVGLGGWANYSSQHIHLRRTVAEVADKIGAQITVIHEAAHLANPYVDDRGYYGSDGFEGMATWEKVANAAHYEELPRRVLGKSSFAGVTFKPGKSKSGAKLTFEDEVRRGASEYLRKAWDKAVDVHQFLRQIRKDIEAGSITSFAKNKKRILEISKLEHLTIHDQTPAPITINLNDIVLSEGVARACSTIKAEVKKQPVPAAPVAPKKKADHIQDLIDACIKSFGALTGNDADDKALMDWLVKEYRKAF